MVVSGEIALSGLCPIVGPTFVEKNGSMFLCDSKTKYYLISVDDSVFMFNQDRIVIKKIRLISIPENVRLLGLGKLYNVTNFGDCIYFPERVIYFPGYKIFYQNNLYRLMHVKSFISKYVSIYDGVYAITEDGQIINGIQSLNSSERYETPTGYLIMVDNYLEHIS